MYSEFVILGGGVAGLCAVNRLLDLGVCPLIIEGGTYPAHKVCGEFLSPDSIPLLKEWNIHPLPIHEVHFHSYTDTLKYSFSSSAGSLSHITLDPLLVKRASKAHFRTNTRVIKINPGSPLHTLELDSGEIIHAKNLIIATGKIPSYANSEKKLVYTGIKAHFEGQIPQNILEMFFFKNSYVGISPVENGKFNVACLCKNFTYQEQNNPSLFIENLKKNCKLFAKRLDQGKMLFSEWMLAKAPEFSLKDTPLWPNTYFIGDAAGSIPPATGNGLTLAIKGGIMAADFSIRGDSQSFREAYRKEVSRPIFWGKILNCVVMKPWAMRQLIKFGKFYPKIIDTIFDKTR